MLPELRIALTTLVCTVLVADALLPKRPGIAALLAGLTGFAIIGCWQTWAAAAAGSVIVAQWIVSLIARRSQAHPTTTRWLALLLIRVLAVMVPTLVLFGLLAVNPYTWVSELGAFPYATLVFITGGVVAVETGASFMAASIRPFAEQLRDGLGPESVSPPDGFFAGGRTIGRYERLLVYVLLLIEAPTAIGFLIAAKSIFRFGDLTDRDNRRKAEYILLGTLMSFTFAVITSIITRTILSWY